MKITKSRLRKIIKEEIEKVTTEGYMSKMSDENKRLVGYRDALTLATDMPREFEASLPDRQNSTIYLYDGGWDTGLAQLLKQGDISQEEYDAMLSPDRNVAPQSHS